MLPLPPMDYVPECNEILSKNEATQLKMELHIQQLTAQCGVLDEAARKYKLAKYCYVGDESTVDEVHCICHGTSLHSAFSPPPINAVKWNLSYKNINKNPEPMKFICCAFGIFCLLYFAAVYVDAKRKAEVLFLD